MFPCYECHALYLKPHCSNAFLIFLVVVALFISSNKVLPAFDEHKISVLRVLTDRNGEYCGKKDTHIYLLFLQLQGVEYIRTKARYPQTNGPCEKFNQSIDREFYAIAFRKKLYSSIEELLSDLDIFMKSYNQERTNQGK